MAPGAEGPADEQTLLLSSQHDQDRRTELTLAVSPTKEMWLLFRLAIPVSLSYMLQNSIQTLSVVIVGRLGPDELSAAAHGYMIAMVTAWCIALGGTTALDTLASALFTSSSPPTEVGIVLQRTSLILLVLYIPVTILWYNVSHVLLALGQTELLACNAQTFLRALAFGAPGYILFESVKKFLQVQGIMSASTLVLCLTSPLNIGLNLLFVSHFGLVGAAYGTSLTYWFSFLLLCIYARLGRGRACWGGFSTQAFRGWAQILKLALPGILMVGTEWWAFEIVALAAGRLPPPALAAQSVIMTVDQILNTLPFGLGVASSARVGNLLGAGPRGVQSAKVSSQSATALSTLVGLAILAVLLATRERFGFLFSDDRPTVRLVANVLPYVAIFQVFDGWANSCGGVLRGLGRQHVGAIVNLGAYYLLALPLGIFLAFKAGQGLAGLWIGQCIALFLVGFGEWALVTFATDWKMEGQRALQRVEGTGDGDQPVGQREGHHLV